MYIIWLKVEWDTSFNRLPQRRHNTRRKRKITYKETHVHVFQKQQEGEEEEETEKSGGCIAVQLQSSG